MINFVIIVFALMASLATLNRSNSEESTKLYDCHQKIICTCINFNSKSSSRARKISENTEELMMFTYSSSF